MGLVWKVAVVSSGLHGCFLCQILLSCFHSRFAVTVNMTLGCWFYLYALSLGYQAANLVNGQAANAVLPFAIMVSEGAFIYTTQTSHCESCHEG